MAWLLLLAGVFLAVIGIRGLYRISRVYSTDAKNHGHELNEVNKSFEDKFKELKKISRDIDKIINELSWKEKNIKHLLDKLPAEELLEIANEKTSVHFKEYLSRNVKDSSGQNEENNNNTHDKVPDKYSMILKLQDKGLNQKEIAEKLDIGIRETELVFKFYGREADSLAT